MSLALQDRLTKAQEALAGKQYAAAVERFAGVLDAPVSPRTRSHSLRLSLTVVENTEDDDTVREEAIVGLAKAYRKQACVLPSLASPLLSLALITFFCSALPFSHVRFPSWAVSGALRAP